MERHCLRPFFLAHSGIVTIDNDSLNLKIYQKQRLDGGEAKFYVYIQSTTMERPDLERAMEQVLPYENKTNYSSWFW
jgi:hypothetical protein